MTQALIVVGPKDVDAAAAPRVGRADASFVAHLIATAAQAPQTRLRRRAEPDAASAAYRALGHWPSETGTVLSRSL